MNPHIYVLILNWNGKDVLKPCLDSILKMTYTNFSVMVVDNGSNDGSTSMVVEDYPKVQLLSLDKNYGYAKGYNRCFNYLKQDPPEYVVLLNNDTEVDSRLLDEFVQATEEFGKDNIYGAKILYFHKRDRIWYAGGIVKLAFGLIYHKGIRQIDTLEYSKPMKTDYVTGCCLFTSWKTINKMDGFDEGFRQIYCEDVDLCLRAKKNDIHCYFWPEAKLWHHVSAAMGGNFGSRKLMRKYSALFRLWIKHILHIGD